MKIKLCIIPVVLRGNMTNLLHSQEQRSGGVFIKRCSKNMQQIYRRTPMLIEITLQHGCLSVNLLHIFRVTTITLAFALLFSEQLHTWHMLTKCHQILMKTYRTIFSISKSRFKTWYIKFVISPEGIVIWCCWKKTTRLRWRQRTVKYLIFQVL